MRKTLRPYQLAAVNKIQERLKSTVHPLLAILSVGAGKTIVIAELLLWIEKANYQALCLTLSSTLVEQNHNAYKDQGGNPGIYCAALNAKEHEPLIIFASPQSVAQGIKNKDAIHDKPFNLIIVDEAHNINPHDRNTLFQRIINHYGHLAQLKGHSYRIIGLTGTPYRGKGYSIIGNDQFFKEEVCNISASWLISQGYLTKPEFGLKSCDSYDFSTIRINSMGKFNSAELATIVDSNSRLTGQIMQELQKIMQSRKGAFIFASTRKHCLECAKSLPDGEWAIITAETPHEERKNVLSRAKTGQLRYLVSVNCLNIGVDVPNFDVCAWLRPTASLVLYTQGIGRVLRLHPGKTSALILDYAGNLERHGDIDDPIINEALQPKEENEKDYIIPCLSCGTHNCVTARRCIGMVENKRCEHLFEWKECPGCNGRNDITTRLCVHCDGELIDPNAKLSLKAAKLPKELFDVREAKYSIQEIGETASHSSYPVFNALYECINGLRIYESFHIRDSRTANIFYGSFLKNSVDKPSQYYPYLQSATHLKKMLEYIITPYRLECSLKDGKYKINKRIFYEDIFTS